MPETTIPAVKENYSLGMNSYDSPKNLIPNMLQLLENALPGISIKPINGVNDAFVSTTKLGIPIEAPEDTFFRPNSVYVEAGGKEFFFIWSYNSTHTDQYLLEIWNLTDSIRTKLIYADFNRTDVYFDMIKLYDAVYITMNYEMTTNHVSTYRTKNKIVEWDSDASDWLVREMGIDVAGSFQELSIEDMKQTSWEARASHEVVFFNGKLWMGGGASGTEKLPGLLYSLDGVTWKQAMQPNIAPFDDRIEFGFLVYDNKLWVIAGSTYGTSYKNDVWYSTDGTTWTRATASAAFSGRYGLGVCVYNDLMWVISGRTGAASYADDVYSSSDGVTWTLVKSSAAFTACSQMGIMVYDNKMWMTGGYTGSYIDEVYYSSDGDTWTQATATAAFGNRGSHSVAVHRGKMWVIHGYSGSFYDDVYSSTDGATWTQETADTGIVDRAYSASCIFLNKIWLWGGIGSGSTYYNDSYASSDGVTWDSQEGGLTPDLFRSYSATYVRRTDSYSKLASMVDYEYSIWEDWRGRTVVSVDEKLLTGTVSLSGTALTGTGSGTAFDTQLAADDYIRIDGKYKKYKITSVTDATNAVVVNNDSDTYTTKEFSLLPLADDPITTDKFNVGVIEGIEDIENRQIIEMIPPTTTNGRVFIQIPDVTDALAQGATHLRVWRTLGHAVQATAEGLTHRYLVDIALSGQGFTQIKIYRDKTTDNALRGETNYLEMTGYDVPPQGRYIIWAGEILWIGGVPGHDGKWFHSVRRGTPGVSFNTKFPQKYASMFDLGEDFIVCDPSDGQKDTGVAELHGDLYFFKERKVFVLSGSDPHKIPDRRSSTIGCACPHTLVHADIPQYGGECLLFESDKGPAYVSAGGKVGLVKEYLIDELWPDKTGILKLSNGNPTNWYTRNKITCSFWQNTWWFFYGDSRDASCQLSTNKIFGFHYGSAGNSIGPFQRVIEESSSVAIYQPQILVPIDNIRAYTFSHCIDVATAIHYRLTRFCDPTKFQDTFDEVTIPYNMKYQTRFIYSDPLNKRKTRQAKAVILFIDFVDSEDLTITINVDKLRHQASAVYSETRQTGVFKGAGGASWVYYRDLIQAILPETLFSGRHYNLEITKVVPSDGNVEIFNQEIDLYPEEEIEPEYYDALDQVGTTYFVIDTEDEYPKEDAHDNVLPAEA